MRTSIHLLILLGLTTSLWAQTPDCETNANSIVIRFDPPSLPGGIKSLTSWLESGFSIKAQSLVHHDYGQIRFPDNGSAYITPVGRLSVQNTSGETFNLQAVDLAEINTVIAQPLNVTFTGFKPDGSSNSQTFVLDGIIDSTGPLEDFETFCFDPWFTDLTRVEANGGHWSMDNLVVDLQKCVDAPEGMIAWWRAESNAWDSVSGFDGQYLPSTYGGSFTTGKVGSAFYLNAGTYVRVPRPHNPDDGLTIEAWVRQDLLRPSRFFEWYVLTHQIVAASLGAGGEDPTVLEATLTSTNSSRYRTVTFRSAPGVLTNQVWQHVALTFDKTSGIAAIYCDGVSVAQTNLGSFTPATYGDLYLGRHQGFLGAMDEFSLYERALTPEEIQSIYDAGNGGKCLPPPKTCAPLPAEAVAWWPGESNMWDIIGAHDAVVYPPVPYYPAYTNGKVGTAFNFLHPGQLTAPASPELDVGRGSGFTFETWIMPLNNYSGALCGWGGAIPPQSNTPYGVRFFMQQGQLIAYLTRTNGQTPVVSTAFTTVVPNIWQHVAITGNTGSGEVVIYVNGQPVTQRNIGPGAFLTSGAFGVGHSVGQRFPGLIDEPTLYSRPLNHAEIQSIFLAGAAGKCPAAPDCTIAESDIAGWWRGESNALDSVSVNHGQTWPPYISPAIGYANGRHGAAFSLRTGNYVVVSNPPSLNVGTGPGLTIEAWINPVSSIYPIVEWNNSAGRAGGAQGVYLSTSPTRGPLYLEANLIDEQGMPHVVLSPPTLPVLNQWRHVAVTYDKASGEAAMYVDGSVVTQTNLGSFTPRTTGNLYLGYRPLGQYPGSGMRFNGLMDEVTVYRRALTASELRCSQRNGPAGKYPPPAECVPPAEGIVSWWRFESDVLDSVGDSHGVPRSSITYTNGRSGQAVFTAASSYVIVPTQQGGVLAVDGGLTVEGWINPSQATPGTILSWTLAGVHLDYFPMGQTSIRANLYDTDRRSHYLQASSGLVQTGRWQHVALTYDNASGFGSIFLDGVVIVSTNLGSFTPQTTGSIFLGYGPAGYFRGALDEFAIHDRALSSFEIHSIYSSQNGRCMESPMITRHPESMRVNAGTDVALTVETMGNPLLRYQWFRNGQLIYMNQSVATESLLKLTGVTESDQGTYHVVVTNAFGTAVSSNAVLLVNYPPVAVASAARSVLVLPPCTNEVVAVLDGSRSSDPDDDPLDYRWFAPGAAVPVATGMVAVMKLTGGTHAFDLVVDDGLLTDTNRVTVEVLTVVQALQRLIGAVVEADWMKKQPLLASLNAALGSISRGQFVPAINQLEAFEHKLQAQVAPKDEGLAASLGEQAHAIITALSACDPHPGKKHGKVKAEHSNGKVKMEFEASNAGVFIIEASCDMVQWEKIGVARETESGRFGFEDANAWRYPCRFYRIVTP